MNTNVEFRLAGDAEKQYAVAANGFTNNIEYSYMNTTQEENGLYHTVAEMFVPYSELGTYNASSASVPANFYFKVGGMYGNPWYTGGGEQRTATKSRASSSPMQASRAVPPRPSTAAPTIGERVPHGIRPTVRNGRHPSKRTGSMSSSGSSRRAFPPTACSLRAQTDRAICGGSIRT